MLLINYVSIMILICNIDWKQYWKCDWTMNIGANRNAHGKWTVPTKQPQVTDLTVGLPDIGGNELVFRSLDCFAVRLIFLTRLITRMKSFSFFFFFFFGGGVSSNAFTIWCCIPISRPRGYLDVSNIALVFICTWINGWVNNRKAGDLCRRHRAHYDVTVMLRFNPLPWHVRW